MKRLLVVVDYQNDFVTGSLGFEKAPVLDEGIAAKVLAYGRGNVLYTLDTHSDTYLDSREGKSLPVEHCVAGTEGHNVFGKTGEALKLVGATKLLKPTFGLPPNTMSLLAQQYTYADIVSIELVGLVTNICILSNAVTFQAAFPEAQLIVDASLCASFDEELHNKTLDVLEGLQVNVINR